MTWVQTAEALLQFLASNPCANYSFLEKRIQIIKFNRFRGVVAPCAKEQLSELGGGRSLISEPYILEIEIRNLKPRSLAGMCLRVTHNPLSWEHPSLGSRMRTPGLGLSQPKNFSNS